MYKSRRRRLAWSDCCCGPSNCEKFRIATSLCSLCKIIIITNFTFFFLSWRQNLVTTFNPVTNCSKACIQVKKGSNTLHTASRIVKEWKSKEKCNLWKPQQFTSRTEKSFKKDACGLKEKTNYASSISHHSFHYNSFFIF